MRLFLFICSVSWGILTATAQPNQSVSIEPLRQQLAQAQHDTMRLRLCVAIGKLYYTSNRYDSLYPYIQRGMHLLSRAPNPNYASDLYLFLARYYRYRGLYKQGIEPIQQAIHFAQQARNVRKTAECQYTLAMIYSDASEWQQAINQIGVNLKYIQRTGLNVMLTDNYLLIIELFKELRNKPMQALYTDRFLALANQHAVPADRMCAYELKAGMLLEQGHLKEAITTYRKAVDWAHLTNNTVYVIAMMNELGTAYRSKGQYLTAKRIFSHTFIMAKAININADMAVSKRELAMVYLALQQPKEALRQARYALLFSRRNKTDNGIMASLECLGQVSKANGLYREAISVYQEEHRLKEEKYTERNSQQIAIMQAQFETETKEKTIKILQKNAQINQLKVLRQQQQLSQSQRNQLTSALIISLLFLLIGVVYLFLRRSQQAYAILQQTARELSEANEVKNKLFSVIGHDLRSPIASMKTTLYQAQVDKAPLKPVVNRLKRQVDSVLDLLTNLLDWSLLQLKGLDLIQEPIRLYDIVEETVSQIRDLLDEKQLGLINQVSKTSVVIGNKHQLRAIVRNLLNNAIKFTPLGGYIRLHSATRETYVELSIRDSGIGMSAEQLARLLTNPEVRSGTMGEHGTGLGLRISRELVERQGGSLHAASWPQGGTQIKIRLPAYEGQSIIPEGINTVQTET